MPKSPTFPTLYDELKTVSISFLKQYGYLKLNQWQSGTITWSRNGNTTGSISISVNTQSENPYLELDYKCNEVKVNYKVKLVSNPSNLGKGVVWYFLCPKTGKRCRKLYLVGTYFYHRKAFNGCMYEKQTQSKKYRQIEKAFGAYFQSDNLYKQLYKKHFKKQYSGKPTKLYLKIMEQIRQGEQITDKQIQALFHS